MKPILLAAGCIALAGCASTPVPSDRLARAQVAVTSAEQMNAGSDPTAPTHLQTWRQQLDAAQSAIKNGDNDKANSLLLRSHADADVAQNFARAKSMRIAAEQQRRLVAQACANSNIPACAQEVGP